MTSARMNDQPHTEAWHLDKRVPIALILTICVQTGFAVSWMTSLSNRVDAAIEANVRQDRQLDAVEAIQNAQAVNAATTAAQLTALGDSVNEVKQTLAETNRLLRGLATREVNP